MPDLPDSGPINPGPGGTSKRRWSELTFGAKWRTAVVRLPRLTPRPALRILAPEGPYPSIVKIPSRYGSPIAVWVFLPPSNKLPPDGHVAVHLDFHGGGFFMGSCLEQAPFCAKLARERGVLVLCVDHAMGPRRAFPAALEDAEDVLAAVLDLERATPAGRALHAFIARTKLPMMSNWRRPSHKSAASELRIDRSRLSFSGFSSGGNLALNLVLSTDAADGHKPWPCIIPASIQPIPVILFYPQVHQKELPADRPLKRGVPKPGRFAQGLDRTLIPLYLPEHLRHHPRANPGLADPKNLHPMARLFVVISGVDTLVDQIDTWVAGVERDGRVGRVETFRAPGMGHGFANLPERMLDAEGFRAKREAYARMMSFWDHVAGERPRERDNRDPRSFEGEKMGP